MEEFSVSIVRQSLVRRVVMGSMPQQWLWANVITTLFAGAFIYLSVNLIVALFIIPLSVLLHILLHKAYAIDEMFFSVYFRHLMMPDYLPATSRVHYIQNKYRGN